MPTPRLPDPPEGSPQPRKSPRQARSRITVDAILEATAQVLVAYGFDSLTTIRVAERAGVSVGTLYQYYPDKAALVAAIVEASLSREAEGLAEAFATAADLPLAQAVERLIRTFVGVHAEDPQRSAAVMIAAPHVEWEAGIASLAEQMVGAVHALLVQRADETRVSDPDLAAYVAVTSVHALVRRALLERPDAVASGAIADQACDAATQYLVRPSAQARDLPSRTKGPSST